MHGLQPGVLLAIALAWTTASAEAPLRQSAPQTTPSTAASLLHHDAAPIELFAGPLRSVETARVHVPGASFVKLHFARFELPDGVTVEVANPSGTEVYRYRNGGLDGHTLDRSRGDDGRGRFFAMSVTGETALVRLTGKLHRFDPDRHGVVVDHWVSGSGHAGPSDAPGSAKDEPDSHLETTCGVNERFDARCYQDSHPAVYDRSIPVAKVITAYGEVCTAWRVGPSNRMFTVQHCISGQDDLDGAEIWFQYRAVSCGASSTAEPIKVTGGELLATDGTLDYALFTVDDFDSIAYLGHLGLDVRNAELGEGIFIPQHGLGQPKQIALESDMNVSGLCEVDDPDHKGYAEGSDIGYFCDTTTSSSGSPVVSRLTGDVIALHHLGGCFNSASKMSLIWPQVSAFFGGVVPHGDGDVPWYEDEPASEPGHGGANLAPEADFTYACDGLDCQFDASASMDDDGYIETYSWDFGDGATGSGIDSNHEFGQEGSYTVTLNVVDDQGGSDSYDRTVTVTAPNQPPKARLSAQCIDNACQFSGAASSDPDGQVVSWSWKFGDGVSASGSQVSHEYAATGSYTVTLTVKDDKGASDIRSYTATVRLPNQAPHAEFELDCDALQCRLDASASADPDGSIVVYLWDLGDGQTATGVAFQHRYAVAGDYRVSLTVEDEGGALASTSRQVRVEAPAPEPKPEPEPEPEPGPEPGPEPQPEPEPEPEPEPQPEPQPDPDNRAPKAGFAWECDGLRCAFDGELSRDSDGEVVSWQWDFGDGRTASGAHYTHRFRATGRFRVNLVVEDDDGAKGAASIYLDVEAADSSPVAEFSVDCSERSCKLDAGSSTASDSGKMRFDWSFGDGATGQGRTVTHDYARDGVYRVTLKVSDGKNLSDTHSRTVEVVSGTSIELRAEGSRMNGRSVALLTWAGAEGDSVQIHRDGKLIATPPNTGKYLDRTAGDLRKAARYQVCDSLGESCSVEILVALGPAWSTQPSGRESLPGKFKR